jgi:hypothetical protein
MINAYLDMIEVDAASNLTIQRYLDFVSMKVRTLTSCTIPTS